MIRRNESLPRLSRPGLIAVLLAAGAALPLAPTLAQVENPKQEQRELTITRVDSEPGAENPRIDVIKSPDGTLSVVGGEGSVVITSAGEEPSKQFFDARTGATVEMRGGDLRIVQGNDIDQARAEVEQLSAALAQAKQRLKELEKRGKNADMKGRSADIKEAPMGMPGSQRTPKSAYLAKLKLDNKDLAPKAEDRGDDSQRRLDKLEQKLERIDELLSELRDMKNKDRKEKDNPKSALRP
jgi:hypothetical protein